MNIEVVGLVSQETMVNGWGNEEKVLLFVFWRISRQLSNIVNQTRHRGKVVRLDNLGVVQRLVTKSPCRWRITKYEYLYFFLQP